MTDIGDIAERRNSVRGYLPREIPKPDLTRLFEAAQQAPSWCNIQPWRVVVTSPPMTAHISEIMIKAAKSGYPTPDIAFPMDYPEPYKQHRRACGHALYGAMGIKREDKARRYDAWLRNYEFFDAPHLAVVSRDQRLGEYATLDLGVWLGVLLTAAEAMGIHSCPMASVAAYPAPLREHLDIPDDEAIIFGIVLGYVDEKCAANATRTTREPLDANVRFIDQPPATA